MAIKVHLVQGLKQPLRLFQWAVEYTGHGAILVKNIPVLMMLAAISSPCIAYPSLLKLAVEQGEPMCYAVYVLWLGIFFSAILFASMVEYARVRNK
jgi:hypothetical protein